MTSAFGGGAVLLTHRPTKATIEIYPDQDLDVFLRVPPGEESWPAGTAVELRFLDGPGKTATVLDTVACDVDVDGRFVHARVESSVLADLPDRSVFAFYAALPTSPTTDYVVVTGITKPMKLGA